MWKNAEDEFRKNLGTAILVSNVTIGIPFLIGLYGTGHCVICVFFAVFGLIWTMYAAVLRIGFKVNIKRSRHCRM